MKDVLKRVLIKAKHVFPNEKEDIKVRYYTHV